MKQQILSFIFALISFPSFAGEPTNQITEQSYSSNERILLTKFPLTNESSEKWLKNETRRRDPLHVTKELADYLESPEKRDINARTGSTECHRTIGRDGVSSKASLNGLKGVDIMTDFGCNPNIITTNRKSTTLKSTIGFDRSLEMYLTIPLNGKGRELGF